MFFSKKAENRRRAFVTEEEMASYAQTTDPDVLRDSILACLYAGALGDALGYSVEFDSWNAIKRRFGENGVRELVLTGERAVVSDDTQMTLFTAEGLGFGFFRASAKGVGATAADYIHASYLCWYRTQGGEADSLWAPVSRLLQRPEMHVCRAPGNTCLAALGSGKAGTISEPINNSKGCGGVMRTAPLGFLRCRRSGSPPFGPALVNGAEAAALTHGHPMGWIPAGMFSDMIDRCLFGRYGSLEDVVEDALQAARSKYGSYPEFPDYGRLIRRAIDLAHKDRANGSEKAEPDEISIRSLGEGWVADEALAIAVYAVLRRPDDVKQCLRTAVNHGGDSDSTGAIAGNILGAFLGLDAIPRDWVDKLELTDAMEEIADMMQRAFVSG